MLTAVRSVLLITVAVLIVRSQPADSRPEFEVASLKVHEASAAPGRISASGGPGTPDPGHFTASGMPLLTLIERAYGLPSYQIRGPEWLKMERCDLVAKLPNSTTREQFALMLQRLLESRLGLITHKERAEMAIYELVVAKNGPKLKESAGNQAPAKDFADLPRPSPRDRALDGDGYPILSDAPVSDKALVRGRITQRLVGATLEQITALLSGQVDRPLFDQTGLSGKYDVVLHYALDYLAMQGGGPTMIEAVQSELGLKLESKKRMADILVIDHVEKVPVNN